MGAYDEDEHERRAAKASQVDTSDEDKRVTFEGSVEYDSGDSAEALIEQFHEITDE